MQVAVITPYYNEALDVLVRCKKSIEAQTYNTVKQIFVADGKPNDWLNTWKEAEHIILSNSHRDAGATPRAIGAISAFSRNFDAVTFLDADNTCYEFHIESMIKMLEEHKTDLVTTTRNICTLTGDVLYTDTWESNGNDFCDTNCMILTRKALPFLTAWVTTADQTLWSDRIFWNTILNSGLTKYHYNTPTVKYHSKWAAHYLNAGKTPPAGTVWIDRDANGNLIHRIQN